MTTLAEKPTLKVKQTDFWPGFPYDDNYILQTLRKVYHVVITEENPDVLLYSSYGKNYLKYDCYRIQFISENIRPDFTAADFSFGFDYSNDIRYYRLPLYFFYMLEKKEKLLESPSQQKATSIWASKKKFCCMVVSNGLAKERIRFFHELSKYKAVDSGGRFLNTVGGPVPDKEAFIKDYRFVIAFENSAYPGYTTEKILEPLLAESIPVYWGNPMIEREFNPKRILVSENGNNFTDVIDQIKLIDQSDQLAIEILQQPVFRDNKLPASLKEENFQNTLLDFVGRMRNTKPVAQTLQKFVHTFKRKRNTLQAIINSKLNRNFR